MPRLRLLGAPALLRGELWLPLQADRAHGLLALLACRRLWVPRDELADLLYPGRDLESARSNLRKVIFLARKVPDVGEIEQQGELLRWAPDSDLARFEAAFNARRYADAVALYGGPLLLGLDAAWPPGSRDWLEAERQRLQSVWHEACLRRLAELDGDPEAQSALAQTMLRYDPLDELALHALGRAAGALGRGDEALAAMARYGRQLAQDLDLPPSAALQGMAHALQASSAHGAAESIAGGAIFSGAVIGRRHELSQIRSRLQQEDCRLLTLLGPPGVGKSATARAALAGIDAAGEVAARWVPLEDLQHADQFPGRVAERLGLTLDGARPPWDALSKALGDTPRLLVLDNVEHLDLGVDLGRLLFANRGLRILATSRAPLGVAGEWRLTLEGLPLPDADERAADVLRHNDAVRLFEARARPLAPEFDLAAEAADLVRLLHEVEGLPLAIELLAAWRRLMPVREIVAELQASLDVLEPAVPSERGVRASFAKGWQQLGPVEQRVLGQMALLPGPVDREMARTVLQAALPALAALVDRSLVRAEGDGSFGLHPLIRRCARPLAGDDTMLRERHARFLAHRFARAAPRPAERHAKMGAALAHVRAAWQWAVQTRDASVLGALLPAYGDHLLQRGLWQEGQQAMAEAVQALAGAATDGAEAMRQAVQALTDAWIHRAEFEYRAGQLDASLDSAARGLEQAERLGDTRLQVMALNIAGLVRWQRGDHAQARALVERGLPMVQAHGDRLIEARTCSLLALVDRAQGHHDAALDGYRRAIGLYRAEDDLSSLPKLYNNLGALLNAMDRPREASEALQEGLHLVRLSGNRSSEPFLAVNLALAHERQGDVERAWSWSERALDVTRQIGEPMIEAAAWLTKARLTARRDCSDRAALSAVWRALAIGERLRSPPLLVTCIASGGLVIALQGRLVEGAALMLWAQGRPEVAPDQQAETWRHLDTLGLDAATLAIAAAALPPDAPLSEALARLPAA